MPGESVAELRPAFGFKLGPTFTEYREVAGGLSFDAIVIGHGGV